jgi:hypothetical protein
MARRLGISLLVCNLRPPENMRSTLLTISLLFSCSLICLAQQNDTSESHFDFSVVLNRVLPIEQQGGLNIGFRSYRDLYTETLEYSFLLSYDPPKDKVSFVSRAADSISIHNQFSLLRRQNPTATIENLAKQIKIEELFLSEDKCPDLRKLFFSFEKIRFRSPSSDLIVLHPMIYEIKSSFAAGDMYLTFVEKEQPLVKWALKVKTNADGCARSLKH